MAMFYDDYEDKSPDRFTCITNFISTMGDKIIKAVNNYNAANPDKPQLYIKDEAYSFQGILLPSMKSIHCDAKGAADLKSFWDEVLDRKVLGKDTISLNVPAKPYDNLLKLAYEMQDKAQDTKSDYDRGVLTGITRIIKLIERQNK